MEPRIFTQVAAAVLLRDDNIVLVEERRGTTTFWSIPGGGVEPGELLHEAVKREVLEETGLSIGAEGTLAFIVNTDGLQHRSAVMFALFYREWTGTLNVTSKDADIRQGVLVPRQDAIRLLSATPEDLRPEKEPLLAFLRDSHKPRMWAYRNGLLVESR